MRESSMRFGLRDAPCGGHDRIGRAIWECRQQCLARPVWLRVSALRTVLWRPPWQWSRQAAGSAHVRVACVGDLQ